MDSSSQPRLVVSDETWDFGQVNQGPTLTKEIRVKNAGDEPLEVTAVESSCPMCVTGRVEPKTIPPMGQANLILKFFSANVEGKQAKHLTLRTNDPAQIEKKIAVLGMIAKVPSPKIKVDPETWDVGLVAEGQVRSTTLRVRNEGDALLRITGLTPSEAIGVDAPEPADELAPGQASTIKADFLADKGKPGLVKEYVHVESNDPTSPTKVVQVVGYVAGRGEGVGQASRYGVVIAPLLTGALVPGTGRALVTGFRITNRLTDTAVAVEIGAGSDGGSGKKPETHTVNPGASVELRVSLPSQTEARPR